MQVFLLKSPSIPQNFQDNYEVRSVMVFFILIGVPVLIGMVLKFFLGTAAPPKPHQELSDELFDELEPPRRRRRSRHRSSTNNK